jgi:hypothetical protein
MIIKYLPALFLGLFLMITRCKKDEEEKPCACGIEDPQKNIEWVQEF